MSKLLSAARLLPATALLTMSFLSGAAQAQATPDSGKVRISSSAPYQVTAQEAASMETPYMLSNGQILVVRQQDRQFFGRLMQPRELRAKPEVAMLATAPGHFVTPRGTAFAFEQNGERVVIDDAQHLPGLRLPAGQNLANLTGTAAGSASVRLVSR